MNEQARIDLAASCNDCSSIPKVHGAGDVQADVAGDVQLMHNGIKVAVDGHYGAYNTEVIRRLKGHHEPQEEWVYHEVLKRVRAGASILELGSFWAYYSLWFLRSVPHGNAVMVEPLESALDAGRRNFELNEQSGKFIRAAIGALPQPAAHIELWPGMSTEVRVATVDSLMHENDLPYLDILHSDIQGAEVRMLRGAAKALSNRLIRWIFISTHGENIHQRCIQLLRGHGYTILAEHTPSESFSVDGLIVASALREETIRVSRRKSLSATKAKLRARIRVRILEPLGLKPRT